MKANMIEPKQDNAARRTCLGIIRLFNARKEALNDIQRSIDSLNEIYRDLANEKIHETDSNRRAVLTRQLTDNRQERSSLEREKIRKLNQLIELQNDYALNQCELLLGPLN